MGRGSYTAGDWSRLKTTRKLDTATTNEIFQSRNINPKYNPFNIYRRESRDSNEHPNSTPIMIGVDVTGSMGYLSTKIIKESLNELMQKLYSKSFVTDPQLMFAAIGDAITDTAPLQVTEFESDIRIAEQLMDLWIENRGGDLPEDYELAWYFASKHTDIDSFNKRKKKGFCFTIGDAPFHETLESSSIKRIFNDDCESISSVDLAKLASEKYELFHIKLGKEFANTTSILPGRVVLLSPLDLDYLSEIIISLMQISEGMSKDMVIDQWSGVTRGVVEKCLMTVTISHNNEINF